MDSLHNKIAIITGGGRGIGAACAALLAARGAQVVITSRTARELDTTANAINKAIGQTRVLFYQADVSNESQVKELFAFTQRQLGYVSILINNAGIVHFAPFLETPTSAWSKILDVNLKGSVYCSREAFLHMQASKKGGCIVNISSLAGIKGTQKFSGLSAYVASKFAVVGLTEALAVEGKPHNIRVNCVAPGAVNTKMLADIVPDIYSSTNPEDIAKAVVWLCDDSQTAKISGTTLEIHSNE